MTWEALLGGAIGGMLVARFAYLLGVTAGRDQERRERLLWERQSRESSDARAREHDRVLDEFRKALRHNRSN